jgi:hypothetical protein
VFSFIALVEPKIFDEVGEKCCRFAAAKAHI